MAEAPLDLSGARSLAVDSAGQAVDLTLVAGEELRFLKSSAWAPWFTVSRYDYDRIVDSLEALTGSGAGARPQSFSRSRIEEKSRDPLPPA